jgi:NAD(P)-dependent dehydrogenase (short-subunit alcohol dehydrogenase family)
MGEPDEEVAMLLQGKNAIVYGGAGSIGGACSRAFAREGATVHLAGRTAETLEAVAEEIRAAGGKAEPAVVDALDEAQVDEHAARVAEDAGSIDISMNVITHPHKHGTPLWELTPDEYMAPVEVAARTTFITAKAAVRRMVEQGSGVILAFGGPGDRSGPERDYYLGGTQTAFDAIETLRRQLSIEAGPHGVRFVTLSSGGVGETLGEDNQDIVDLIEGQSLLGRTATLEEIGMCAAFAASDHARGMTAATLNVSSGALID